MFKSMIYLCLTESVKFLSPFVWLVNNIDFQSNKSWYGETDILKKVSQDVHKKNLYVSHIA